MDKLISVKGPHGRCTLYALVFENVKGERYTIYMTPEEYTVTMLKRKLVLEFKVPESIVAEFEAAVTAIVEESHLFGV